MRRLATTTGRPRASSSERGSAAIEVIVAVPLLAALAVVAWYLAAGLVAAMDANEALVRAGLDERRGAVGSDVRVIEATARVPAVAALPELALTARARVRPR